jgi:hypothetical protein
MYRLQDAIIKLHVATSRSPVEFFKNHMVVYCPINLDFIEKFALHEREILIRRKKLGIAPDDLVIGRVRRAHVGKWGDILIDMMPHFIKIQT